MSAFTVGDVQRLAALARLELSSDELETFARQLNEILEFAQQVQAVDTAALPHADAFGLAAVAPSRDDLPEPSLSRDEALASAPHGDRATGLFKVPRVLNG